jgi:hypothetical protein
MNFKAQLDTVIDFITNNYKNYLPSQISEPEITTDFLDFDRFKKDFTVFIDFSKIDFRQSNYDDDCGDIEHLSITIFLVHRNNKSEVLQSNNLLSAFAFYQMIRENIGLGIAQRTTIESLDFFNYAEGTKFLVVTEINLSLDVEI